MPRRLLLIVNPHGGRKRARTIFDRVRPVLEGAGIDLQVRETAHRGHARAIVREFDGDQFDGVALIGGDGTIQEVVSGLMERPVPVSLPIGLIPAGSGNDVSQQLGLKDPTDAAERIVEGQTRSFDVIRVETSEGVDYSLTLVGWAGVADINARAERWRRLGPSRYSLAALWQILFPYPRRAVVTIDGQQMDDAFLLVAACNTAFVGRGMRLAPRAAVDDGCVDVVIVRRASRWQLLRVFRRVYDGSHVELPCVEYHQARVLTIHTDDTEPLDIDGEVRGRPPVAVETLPSAVQFFA